MARAVGSKGVVGQLRLRRLPRVLAKHWPTRSCGGHSGTSPARDGGACPEASRRVLTILWPARDRDWSVEGMEWVETRLLETMSIEARLEPGPDTNRLAAFVHPSHRKVTLLTASRFIKFILEVFVTALSLACNSRLAERIPASRGPDNHGPRICWQHVASEV